MDFKETLRSFNRKERNWLVRDALGEAAEHLSESFRARVTSEVRRIVEDFAFDKAPYWATDFHFNWLVGALHKLAHPGEAIETILKNDNGLIRGNQEDFDLVIATGNMLLLIEAKGEGSWSNSQMGSKIARLASMTPRLIDEKGFAGTTRVVLLLCSPRRAPENLDVGGWPPWTKAGDRPLYFELKRPLSRFLTVTRCDERGPNASATHWMIDEIRYEDGP